MARPTAPRERKRSLRLSARFNAAEAGAVADAAARDGVTVSDLLRRAVLPHAAHRRPPAETKELSQLLGAIGRVGSNVNQLARQANLGAWPESAEIDAAASDIRAMRVALMRALNVDPGPPAPPPASTPR